MKLPKSVIWEKVTGAQTFSPPIHYSRGVVKGGKGGPGPLFFGTTKILRTKILLFDKRKIKVCNSYSWRCPGTSVPSAPHLTVSLYLSSSGSNARGEEASRGPEKGAVSAQKARLRRGSCWEERKRIVYPRWGVIDLPSRQINEFSQKGNRKKLS